MALVYTNFDLFVDRTDGAYRLRVLDSPVGQAQTTVVPDGALLAIQAAIAAGWQVEEIVAAQDWGRTLYATLFADAVELCLLRSLDSVERRGQGLRIRLHLTEVPELAALPWELVYSPRSERFLALSTTTPIVRYLALATPAPGLLAELPLAILCVLADPTDLEPRLEVEVEWQRIQAAVAPLVAAGQVTLQRLADPTVAALRSQLRSQRVHLLHFIGHGWYDPASQSSGLVLEEETGQAALVDAALLSVLLEGEPPLRAVFLNACAGARVDERNAFRGTAQQLVRLGIPLVVALQFDIVSERAVLLAQEFYRAMAEGYPAEAALAEARRALFEPAAPPDWSAPVLFARSADNRLVARVPESVPARPRLPFEPEMRSVPAGPFVMGAANAPPEWQQHRVDLARFAIGRYPVTNAQYAAFVREQSEHRPQGVGWFFTTPPAGRLEHPVVGISWHAAVAYCRWLAAQSGRAYRLPTEAEWEKAARSDDGRTYPWGEAPPSAQYCSHGGGQTAAVTATAAGCSPYGVCDLIGNVREWTATRWGDNLRQPQFVYPYRSDEREQPTLRANELCICRGGAYDDPVERLTCTARLGVHAAAAHHNVGFRVAYSS